VFTNTIITTPLTSEAADRLFSNITSSNNPDRSFLATLRVLLRNRMPQDETVHISYRDIHLSEHEISNASVSQRMIWYASNITRYTSSSDYCIDIINTTQPNAGNLIFETLTANAGTGKRYLSKYTRRDDLKVFYARKANALFYTDTDERHTVIYTDRLDIKGFHALQMMIPKYLPRLFRDNADCIIEQPGEQSTERITNPLTEKETLLLKSAGDKTSSEYEKLIEDFAKDFDIRSETIRIKLTGFEKAFERIKIDEVRNLISSYQSEYDNYLYTLRETAKMIQEQKYLLAGLECAVNDQAGDSELMEYFICNKNLSIIRVTGTSIEFVVHGYADIYDEDAFNQYAGNHRGYLYDNLNIAVTKPQMENLYRAIFNDGKYKLRICAAYRADLRTGLKPLQKYIFPSESRTYFHNPHIQDFGCIGTYAGRFQEYLNKKDYVGAIDQAVVSARNLNFYDSTVMSTFAKELSGSLVSCIEKRNGDLLTPWEAVIELDNEARNEVSTNTQ
jgi:hypothetical protein